MEKKSTLIIGASDNPSRYSYLALQRLKSHGHTVHGIGKKDTTVLDVVITKDKPPLTDVDTVTLYLNPSRQKEYYEYIFSLQPRRLIFNPGTENEELETMARQKGIQPLEACTLVMLGTGQY